MIARSDASLILLAGLLCLCPPTDIPTDQCQSLVAAERWHAATAACHEAWLAYDEPKAGEALLRSQYYGGDYEGSAATARRLLLGPSAGTAHRFLGLIARRDRDYATAKRHLEQALELHGTGQQLAEMARDEVGLGSVAWKQSQLGDALNHFERAERLAATAQDARMLWTVMVSRADALVSSGDHPAAERALRSASELASSVGERAWSELKRGLLHIGADQDELAEAPLRLAMATAPADDGRGRDIRISAPLNLAWIARRAGRFQEALELLAHAERQGAGSVFVELGRGQIALDRGDFATAVAHLRTAARNPERGTWYWLNQLQLGDALRGAGDLEAAEGAYRLSLAEASTMTRQAGQLAPHVIAAYRAPHERLIGLLARQGRWSETLAVVGELDLAGMVSAEASPGVVLQDGGVRGGDVVLDERLSGPEEELTVGAPPVDIAEAWRDRRLVIALRDGDSIVRIEVASDAVSGTIFDGAKAIEAAADRLASLLSDVEAARLLGDVLVPEGASKEPLHLLLLGGLSRAPLALLAREDGLVISAQPLVRVLSLVPRPRSTSGDGQPVVLGDPTGNLASSREEAASVASRLSVRPRLGAEATRAALAAGAASGVLHVSAHVQMEERSPRLLLADGAISADEVSTWAQAPGLVVLATCGAAASRDEAGWGSFAAAFLAAGADFVVASRWSVEDEPARAFVEAFYAAGGAKDPIGALSRAQVAAARDRMPPRNWGGFVVLSAPPRR